MSRRFRMTTALDVDDVLLECVPYAIKLANEKYIRQIVAYSVDRENIQKEVTSGNAKIVDLPYG